MIGVFASQLATGTASAASVGLQVESWGVDWDTGVVTYNVTATGTRCPDICSVHLRGWAGNSGAPFYPIGLGSKTVNPGLTEYTVSFTRTPAVLREITEISAFLRSSSGSIVAESAAVTVAPGNPQPAAWLSLNRWKRDPSLGRVEYDFDIHGVGLAGVGEVCEAYCRWQVSGIKDNGQVVTLASTGWTSNKWFLAGNFANPSRALPEFAKLRFIVESQTGMPAPLMSDYPLPDPADDPTQEIEDGYSMVYYAAIFGTVTPTAFCEAVAQVAPLDGPDPDSLPDAFQACETARIAGLPLQEIIRRVLPVAVGGVATLDAARRVLDLDDPNDDPAQPPTPTPNDKPIADVIRGISRANNLSDESAQVIAAQCRRLVAAAMPLPGYSSTRHPCTELPAFIPGSDVLEAAQHKLDAIAGNPAAGLVGNPSWVYLNHVGRDTRHQQGLSLTWYAQYPPCAGQSVPSYQCDEFPYYSSKQSGPGASLRWVIAAHNTYEGSRLGNFVTSCGLGFQDPYLVIPLPFESGPPTTWTMNGCQR